MRGFSAGDPGESGDTQASSSMAMTIGIGFSGGRSVGEREKGWMRRTSRRVLGLRIRRHIVSSEWQKTVVRARMKIMKRMWNIMPPPMPVAARPR